MARVKNSTDNPLSRYVQGGLTDRYTNRLGWWERRILIHQTDDLMVVLESKYENRPDLLAYDLYGRATLAWLILQYNNIVDINEEFVVGATIFAPTRARVFSAILTAEKSGNVV